MIWVDSPVGQAPGSVFQVLLPLRADRQPGGPRP